MFFSLPQKKSERKKHPTRSRHPETVKKALYRSTSGQQWKSRSKKTDKHWAADQDVL